MIKYSDELIDEIRNSNDIIEIVSQYVTLKRKGSTYFGLCPFHKEKSGSFAVSPEKQIFHCFGCGVGGNVFHFVQKIENLNFREAVESLADRAGISLPTIDDGQDLKRQQLKAKVYEINEIAAEFYHLNLYKPTAKLAQNYVKKRRLDNKTLKMFHIGYAGKFDELYRELVNRGFTEEEILASSLVNKNDRGQFIDRFRNRLMIPIKDVRDRVIAFGGRVLDDSKPKYINSPENIVYSKGRNLFALNLAKKGNPKKILMVEGYMDAISLYQRGVDYVVASLGTALTEQQGRLLRKYVQEVVIGYDADGAGQAATMRGLEILHNQGFDVRILQLDEPGKDPDEYIIKYGSAKLENCINNAISLVEFKVKTLKNTLNIDNPSDKIKFLNEVVKILSNVDNNIEKEVYIEKISKEYNISKEALYAQSNKIKYANANNSAKILERPKIQKIKEVQGNTPQKLDLTDPIIRRENMAIYLIITPEINAYEKIKDIVTIDSFKDEINKKIIKKLYEELEKGNSNINNILDSFEDQEILNRITYIMAYNFEITDKNKAIQDIMKTYEKEILKEKKIKIIQKMDDDNLSYDEKVNLEHELSNVILKLAKIG